MAELVLGQVALALQPEDDLQVAHPSRRVRHPREVARGLVRARRHPQGVHREAGVPEPGEAVVPVVSPPTSSGSEVVGAATIAPLGPYVSAWITSALWRTSPGRRPRTACAARPTSASP